MRLAVLILCWLCGGALAAAPRLPSVVAKAWVVADLTSGQVLGAERADERVEPASLTKLMTAYVVFAAMRERRLAAGQKVSVSERATRVPGSRMFIEAGRAVSVDELVRGMVVQSGNDACIALAEAVAGTEEGFVALMNNEAARLGMKHSRFMNVTGLPHAQHYSSASDLYLLAAALIRDFPADYALYYSQKEFTYNGIPQPNRNRLLWLDPNVDGVKTGYTEAAGYCMVASSRRGGRRLLSVLLGATSEAARTQESQRLLNWGYQSFDSVKLYGAGEAVKSLEVWKGAAATVKIGPAADLVVAVPKGEAKGLKAELVAAQPLVAPLARGQRVGAVRVSLDGKPYGEYAVVALEPVAEAGLLGRAWDTLRLWVK
jgi:D-alanyl-D-alanine carboxypeptidase (penicillin-binding protein 5/6)